MDLIRKTLDEVIEMIENTSVNDSLTENDLDDILYYLCECRALNKILADNHKIVSDAKQKEKDAEDMRMMYIHALAQMEDNPPLTWDELSQLKRKPVWMEEPELFGKDWVIITGNSKYTIFGIFPGGMGFWSIEDMGDKWQAYRKERDHADEA